MGEEEEYHRHDEERGFSSISSSCRGLCFSLVACGAVEGEGEENGRQAYGGWVSPSIPHTHHGGIGGFAPGPPRAARSASCMVFSCGTNDDNGEFK